MAKARGLMFTALLGASALVSPQIAHAQAAPSSREAALMDRLEKLEAEMQALKADLAAARADQASAAAAARDAAAKSDAAVAASDAATVKVTALQSAPQPDGFKVGKTSFKIGGFIKLTAAHSSFSDGEVATNSLGRDFDLPQALPTGNGARSTVQDFGAKQSRFWLSMNTDLGGHAVVGYVEADFQTSPGTQGSQRTTNGYNLALRRAYMQFDNITIGQDWSTFQNVAALPESTDFVGATAGTVFVRQPLIRYTTPVGNGLSLALSVENPESGTATIGSPALVENGDDRIPDFTARLNYAGKVAQLSLAGVARQISVQSGTLKDSQFGWGVSGSGKIFLSADKGSDLRFMVTYGSDIGRYVGLNFAPDALVDPATGDLSRVNVFAALAALHVGLAPKVRVNLIGDYQGVDYPDGLSMAQIGSFNRRSYSGAVNLFYSPYKGIDLGVEYRHRVRDLENGASGSLDRLEFAGKYSF